MGAANTIILVGFIALMLYVGTNGTNNTVYNAFMLNVQSFTTSPLDVLTSATGFVLLAGTLFFPNQFTLFAGLSLLLTGIQKLPVSLLQAIGIPDPIPAFLSAILSITIIFAIMDWYKSSGSLN